MPQGRAKKNIKRVKDAETLHAEWKQMKSKNYQRGKTIELSVAKRRIGGKIVSLTNVDKSFGDKYIVA